MSVAVDIYAELNGAPFAANDNAVTTNGTYRYDGKLKRVTGTEGLYEHSDPRGSPRSLTDVSGSPDEKAFYSPFGMEYGNTNVNRSNVSDRRTFRTEILGPKQRSSGESVRKLRSFRFRGSRAVEVK